MSTRSIKIIFLGVECGRCVGLTALPLAMSRLSIQCGILNNLEPYRPPRPVTGIALLFFYPKGVNKKKSLPIKMMFVCVCVCVCVCPGITLERLERFRRNLVHTLLYACVRILCMFYIYSVGRTVWEAGNLDDSHC
jgi:hypothetical protein